MRFRRQYKCIPLSLMLVTGLSCSSYDELVYDEKIPLPEEALSYRFTDSAGKQKPVLKAAKQKNLVISSKKYLARGAGFAAEAVIMNEGIGEALRGNFPEAEILFKQLQDVICDGSVENNLAVIYELTKRKKEAMMMYMSALSKSPQNPEFNCNLLSFINHNNYRAVSKTPFLKPQ